MLSQQHPEELLRDSGCAGVALYFFREEAGTIVVAPDSLDTRQFEVMKFASGLDALQEVIDLGRGGLDAGFNERDPSSWCRLRVLVVHGKI